MNTAAIIDSPVSKFETRQETESCGHWFHAKTHASHTMNNGPRWNGIITPNSQTHILMLE